MLSARTLLYGFAAILVLFTIVMAIEQIYLREVDAVIAASHPPRNAKPGCRGFEARPFPPRGQLTSRLRLRTAPSTPASDLRSRSGRGRLGASQRSPRAGVSRQRRTSKAPRWTKDRSTRSRQRWPPRRDLKSTRLNSSHPS